MISAPTTAIGTPADAAGLHKPAAAPAAVPANAKPLQLSDATPSAIVNLSGSAKPDSSLTYGAISSPASSSSHAVPHEHDVLTNALLQFLPDSEGGIDVAQIPGAPVDFIKEL